MYIRKHRESLNMTQSQLALQLGVSRTAVAMWETGVNFPSVPLLIKLSEIFNCTIDELVKGEKENGIN